MPGVPSNKACERCKKRHLKCDETRPHCQRCTTAGVECPGYVQTRKFIDQGATPKSSQVGPNEQTLQWNQPQEQDNPALHFQMDSRDDSMIVEMPGPSNRPEVAMGSIQQTTMHAPESPAISIHNSISGIEEGSESSRNTIYKSISPTAAAGGFPTFDNTYTPIPHKGPDYQRVISESSSHRSEKDEFQDIFSELMTGTEHEIAFLTRHYSEVIGPWLDLSDSQKFFTVHVPIRAISNLSVKYAIAALAAKHLARLKGVKASTGGMFTSPATTETYPNATQVDWFLKAANYYYLGASDLNNLTSDGYTTVSSSAILESPFEIVGRWISSRQTQANMKPASEDPNDMAIIRKTEELLASATLLTMYRLLDMPGDEWHMQLARIGPLFESLLGLHSVSSALFSHGIRAAFWNFARQDYLGSYFTRSPTHFDPENLPLWRAAGISINDQKSFHIIRNGSTLSQEDQAANGLIWLVTKVINFLARSKQLQLAQWTGSPPAASPEGTTTNATQLPYPDTDTWLRISFEFQTWFENVPETFRSSVRIERPKDLSKTAEGSYLSFPEIFHGLTTCAVAMQHYHFGRIALLLNRPADVISAPSTAFDRLQGYREVTKEVEFRAREVSGIALGRPQGGVRIFMVPLLVAVGQCLENPEEHQIIVDLLRGVEADLGWTTEYAIRKLQDSWNQ
ncbi:transcriptional regulator family: Fungal Specific TF [Penicillium psychrosexuale]|uniref:transcriptional regulator family: Fungal Specific TF n=1 Tax=Penicillium psychrosexuale TaxID=1002107 RepID=UPI002545904D|nr:transcriptional regulator family: Fungal Specific TF [Penicillium psychrosexuale]KAJ5781939.1 transcriptional regulator family: Fungal Specific TF [Penicillium psychrosexuale]